MALREIFARFSTRFDGAPLRRGNRQVQGLTGSLGGAVGQLGTLGRAFAALAVVQIVRSWVTAVQGFVTEMTHVGRELDLNARRLGVNATQIQAFGLAAADAGQDTEKMIDAVSTLQERMRDAVQDPNSDPAVQLRALGIAIPRAIEDMPDAITLLGQASDGLANMSNQTDRVGAAMTVFGDVGRDLLPVLQQGSGAIEAYRTEAERLGGDSLQELAESSRDLAAANARLDLALLSVRSRLAVALLPIVESAVRAFTEFVAWTQRNEEVGRLFEATLYTLAAAITFVAAVALVATFPLWFTALLIFGSVVVAIGLIVLAVEDLITWFRGGESVIGYFIDALLELAGLSMADVRREINSVFETLRNGYNDIAETIGLPQIGVTRNGGQDSAGEQTGGGLSTGQRILRTFRLAGAGARAPGAANSFVNPAPAGTVGRAGVSQRNEITINGATDTDAVRSVVTSVLDRANREAVEALGQ